MKTRRFAPKDAKIIRENKDASPEELLELGLSKKAYQRLITPQEDDTILQPVKVEALEPKDQPTPTTVQLHNRKSGRVVRMGYKSAKMLSDKYPEEFKIIT